MIEAFRRQGLGVVPDFVPNHMGVGGADNPLWMLTAPGVPDIFQAANCGT
jgi:(1->4)-alpha-D-glucan 1-alpha-D-glucosylmutase